MIHKKILGIGGLDFQSLVGDKPLPDHVWLLLSQDLETPMELPYI